MKPCPYCAEQIQDDARKCKHCGEILDPALRAKEVRDNSGDVAQALELEKAKEKAKRALMYGIVGFVCFGIILGPAAIVLGSSANKTFAKYRQPASTSASVGRTLGVIVTILWTLAILVRVLDAVANSR